MKTVLPLKPVRDDHKDSNKKKLLRARLEVQDTPGYAQYMSSLKNLPVKN
jgi:hypothetical protein